MKCAIEITDRDANGFLTVELRNILPLVSDYARTLEIYLIELDAVLKMSAKHHLRQMQDQIESYGTGLALSWSELVELSEEIFDIQNLTIVGCRPEKVPRRQDTFEELCTSCRLVVECFDSSRWRVCCDDPECIGRIKAAFSSTTENRL